MKPAATVLALWGLGFALLDLFWHGGEYFWAAPLAAGLALAAAAAATALRASSRRRPILLGGLLSAVAMGAWNLHAGVLPRSRIENNIGYQRSLFVRDHTVPSSWVITSGYGFPNAKVYLPHFAHRTRDVLEYHFLGRTKEEGLSRMASFMAGNARYGIPLYLLSDVVEDAAAQKAFQEALGVSPVEVRQAFGPGSLTVVSAQDPSFRIFLFVSAHGEEQLFAALCYSVLTDADEVRLQETAAALKTIAGGMTPAQRRDTARLLEASEYGIQFLRQGFFQYMSPESRRAADARIQDFRQWRQTADFHLRLGNIMRYLGLADEVRRQWTEAYRISRDPGLAKDLARLGAAPR